MVLSPAILYFFTFLYQSPAIKISLKNTLTGGLSALLIHGCDGYTATVFMTLVLTGVLMWPMVILSIALGDFSSVTRVDLMLLTIGRTLPVYLLMSVGIFGVEWLNSSVALFDPGITVHAMIIAAQLYLELVFLRVIEFYYDCFKEYFAWLWG